VWEEMLSKLPEYLINKDGAIAEWIVDDLHDAYDHRHVSHLYPVFPGTELEDSQNKQLINACKRAVDLRYGSFGGWSLPHMSAIYSRLRDPEKAFDSINALSKVCLLENLMTMNYDYREMGITGFECGDEYHTMVQFDALMGTVNALQEMLLFTSPKILRLLPACPKQFSKGNATLHFSTGLVEMCWDLEKETCGGKITALRDTDIQLELPFGKGKTALKMKQGETIDFC
jgi:alpha-L-fucosidase 2